MLTTCLFFIIINLLFLKGCTYFKQMFKVNWIHMRQYQYIQSKLLGLGFTGLDHGIIHFQPYFQEWYKSQLLESRHKGAVKGGDLVSQHWHEVVDLSVGYFFSVAPNPSCFLLWVQRGSVHVTLWHETCHFWFLFHRDDNFLKLWEETKMHQTYRSTWIVWFTWQCFRMNFPSEDFQNYYSLQPYTEQKCCQ